MCTPGTEAEADAKAESDSRGLSLCVCQWYRLRKGVGSVNRMG